MNNLINIPKERCILEFNKTLNILITELEKKYPSSGEVITINNRIKIIKDTLGRDFLIKERGEKIYKYKDKILKRDEEFFEKYENIYNKSQIKEKVKKDENYDLIYNVFLMSLNTYKKGDKKYKDQIYNWILILLSSFIIFYDKK